MRVMPSVTEMMVPTLRASVTDLKFSMRCLMRSEISDALMAMSDSLSSQFVGDALEARTERPVDHQVAALHHRPADELRVGRAVQSHRSLQALLERRRERLLLP